MTGTWHQWHTHSLVSEIPQEYHGTQYATGLVLYPEGMSDTASHPQGFESEKVNKMFSRKHMSLQYSKQKYEGYMCLFYEPLKTIVLNNSKNSSVKNTMYVFCCPHCNDCG